MAPKKGQGFIIHRKIENCPAVCPVLPSLSWLALSGSSSIHPSCWVYVRWGLSETSWWVEAECPAHTAWGPAGSLSSERPSPWLAASLRQPGGSQHPRNLGLLWSTSQLWQERGVAHQVSAGAAEWREVTPTLRVCAASHSAPGSVLTRPGQVLRGACQRPGLT